MSRHGEGIVLAALILGGWFAKPMRMPTLAIFLAVLNLTVLKVITAGLSGVIDESSVGDPESLYFPVVILAVVMREHSPSGVAGGTAYD